MAKRDPLETLRQMRGFAQEAWDLPISGGFGMLGSDLGYRRHTERVAELIGEVATRVCRTI